MPSTACPCVGQLRDRAYDVVVIDPTCRVHGERAHLSSAAATPPRTA